MLQNIVAFILIVISCLQMDKDGGMWSFSLHSTLFKPIFLLGYVAPSYESQEKSQLIEKRDEDKQGFKSCHPSCNGMVPVK